MQRHFDARPEHVMECHKICAVLAKDKSCQGVLRPSEKLQRDSEALFQIMKLKLALKGRRFDIIKIKYASEDALAIFNTEFLHMLPTATQSLNILKKRAWYRQ